MSMIIDMLLVQHQYIDGGGLCYHTFLPFLESTNHTANTPIISTFTSIPPAVITEKAIHPSPKTTAYLTSPTVNIYHAVNTLAVFNTSKIKK